MIPELLHNSFHSSVIKTIKNHEKFHFSFSLNLIKYVVYLTLLVTKMNNINFRLNIFIHHQGRKG